MMDKKQPTFLGSWKGRIIKAIAIDGARTWNEIRDLTGLSPKSLNRALAELMSAKALEKLEGDTPATYKVTYNLYKDYQAYYENQPKEQLKPTSVQPEFQNKIHQWIGEWKDLNGLDFDLNDGHFFLQGRILDEFSKKIISKQVQKELIVVNPFVEPVDISKTLIECVKRGVDTTLITRRPTPENPKKEHIEQFHRSLRDAGVRIIDKKYVHAKIILADKAVAIISSMNFNPSSSSGQSWEAGIISVKDNVVEAILEKIIELQDIVA